MHCVNLDPAAEELLYDCSVDVRQLPALQFCNNLHMYECSIDVRELVSVEDVMVEMNLGPNGGLVYVNALFAH